MKSKSFRDEEVREYFRNKLKVGSILNVTKEKGYQYRWVITTYDHDPDRTARFMDMGWDVVYDELDVNDDRAFAPESKGERDKFARIKPLTKKMKGGHSAILMRITDELKLKNTKDRMVRDKNRELQSSRRGQSKVTRTSEGGIEERSIEFLDVSDSNKNNE